jgi:CRISPR-associated protein Cas4
MVFFIFREKTMEYIPISKINDFVFCPYSLYFHSVYNGFDEKNYKAGPQIAGKLAHKNIDDKKYSSRAKYLIGVEVFSEKYGLIGKIDIYDCHNKILRERKKKINKIYDGYIFQIYAQKVALEEMGYKVERMELCSLDGNKKYPVKVSLAQKEKFLQVLKEIREFNFLSEKPNNTKKCKNCIYRELCRKNI